MSNGEKSTKEETNVFERLLKLWTMIVKMIMDGVRDPAKVADHLQEVISDDTGRFAPAKFALLVDLGTITVPAGYDHAKQLEMFREKNHRKFYFYNDSITDENFPNPTRVLKPGDKLLVSVYRQIASGATTSEERLAFLETQNAVYTGAQGASLVFEQKRNQLPKGKWYSSFDKLEQLWKDADGRHRVPFVIACSDGDFSFDLGYFESVWYDNHALLCFRDE